MNKIAYRYRSFFRVILTCYIPLLLFAYFFYRIQIHVPLYMDDFDFITKISINSDGTLLYTGEAISSVSDMIEAFRVHQIRKNGRMADLSAMVALNIFGKEGFAILNVVVATLFVRIYTSICFGSCNLGNYLFFIAGLVLMLPNLYETVFWAAGACNYLWSSLMLGIFILLYERLKSKRCSRWFFVLCCVMALWTSSMHEALGLPVIGMLIASIIFSRYYEKKTDKKYYVLTVMALFGWIITLISPGIWNRAGREICSFSYVGLFLYAGLPFILLFLCVWREGKEIFKKTIFYFAVLQLILVWFSGTVNSRASFYLHLSAFVLFIQCFKNYIYNCRYILISLASLYLILFYGNLYKNVIVCETYQQEAIARADEGIVVIDTTSHPQSTANRILHANIFQNIGESKWIVWNCKPFIVVFNSLVKDRTVYDIFSEKTDESFHVAQSQGNCYIRFPLGFRPNPKDVIEIYSSDKELLVLACSYTNSKRGAIRSVSAFFRGKLKEKIRYSLDYDGKFFYMVFSSTLDGGYSFDVECISKKGKSQHTIKI